MLQTIPRPKNNENFFYENSFLGLLADAMNFAVKADDANLSPHEAASFARVSILNSAFAIECAANACLFYLDLSQSLRAQFEKFPAIDKYEVALRYYKPEKRFDRGCKEIQAIQEIIGIRNGEVHLKIKRVPLSRKEDENGVPCFDPSDKKTLPVLKIPGDSSKWNSQSAKTCLLALDSFFWLYLIDYCGLNLDDTSKILLSQLATPKELATVREVHCVKSMKTTNSNIKMRFGYFKPDFLS